MTKGQMMSVGASEKEAEEAIKLLGMLESCLNFEDGKVKTKWGEKTPLGLYRTIASTVNFKYAQ